MAESGWDFSTRWTKDNEAEIAKVVTNQIVPVDLNCILLKVETELVYLADQIASYYTLENDTDKIKHYEEILQQYK